MDQSKLEVRHLMSGFQREGLHHEQNKDEADTGVSEQNGYVYEQKGPESSRSTPEYLRKMEKKQEVRDEEEKEKQEEGDGFYA